MKKQSYVWPIALSRMLIGLLWLFSLRWKFPPDFLAESGRGLLDWLQLEVEHAAFNFYGEFVASVVIPNFTLFAWAIFFSEMLTGLSLLMGAFTRLGAAMGLLMSINLGIGLLDVPGEWPWSYAMLAMWHGTFLVTAAGRLWGMDARLHPAEGKGWLFWLT